MHERYAKNVRVGEKKMPPKGGLLDEEWLWMRQINYLLLPYFSQNIREVGKG